MKQWQIGNVKITRIVEQLVSGDNQFVLPDATNEACLPMKWLQPHFMDKEGYLLFSIHALIIDTGERRIMVDTCIGNDKERGVPGWHQMQTAFLNDIEAAGYPRDSIDTVLCTHLHVDHVGWNTMKVDGKWQPTFKNARYLVAETEWKYWDAIGGDNEYGPVMEDSILPVVDAGLMDYIDCDYQVCPEVRLKPTPGHTPGHVSVHISSGGQEALITGDCIHHPCQLTHPEWCAAADADSPRGQSTREKLFAEYVDTDVLIIGTHFAGPTAGYIRHNTDDQNYWLDATES
jgi:glyoxylase-like metal-dependent hydrolase (beta-lactamase superfamily II)